MKYLHSNLIILSCVGVLHVTYKTGFGLDDWICYTLHIHNSGLQAITALSLFYTPYNSTLHTHKSSQSSLVVSWQRIYKSHSHFKSHIKSSLPFLLNHLGLPSPELDPVLDNNSLKWPSMSLYNSLVRSTQKTQPLYWWECLFTDLLHRNGRHIVARLRFRKNVFTE
jgi:hypothetical protein